jgi:hypothetical protein
MDTTSWVFSTKVTSKLDKEKRKIVKCQICLENWKSDMTAFKHAFGSSNIDKLS